MSQFKAIVSGQYFFRNSNGKKELKNYGPLEFIVEDQYTAQGYIAKNLLKDKLKEIDPMSEGARTWELIDIQEIIDSKLEDSLNKIEKELDEREKLLHPKKDLKIDIDKASFKELFSFCIKQGLNLNLKDIKDITVARKMVKDEVANKEISDMQKEIEIKEKKEKDKWKKLNGIKVD
jgi:hypothetical protein